MRNTAAVRVETAATTPASKILTSTPLIVASPSTRASAASKCTCILLSPSTYASATGVAKQRRVRGPTRGKRIRRIIVENKGEKISAYVAPEMKVFCGMNANKVVSERGTQIRWICPIQGFYPSWNNVDSTLKDAIIQAVRADHSGGIGNEGNDDDGNGNEPNNNEGNGNEGRKKLDFCDLYEASHRLRDTKEWIDPKCQEKHQRREREEEKTRREEEQKQREEEQRRREEEREEEKRRWEETQRRQDEERSILLKEMDVFKSFMSQLQNGERGNMGAR
ncbi:hypothetical protein RHSIM_Rhsim05G0127300 [Rhododendron simsii]|uniref:Uncharacterized protein n=1 Tax=Rhododendron simsii TaxID=118357 RepID=A0A834GWE2_RHOSS|nr:hypothetical protein RHSIM_Rhsim05G0127300 [Rhododendron simsii]